MKITIVEKSPPPVTSFTMFANPDFELLRETKTIAIDVRKETKTRLSTTLRFGQYSVLINMEQEGFKTVRKEESNYFSDGIKVSHYFVLSKKQNKEEYFKYLNSVIEHIFKNIFRAELDELTVNVHTRTIFE